MEPAYSYRVMVRATTSQNVSMSTRLLGVTSQNVSRVHQTPRRHIPERGICTRLHEVIPKDSHCVLEYMVSHPITGNYHTAWCHVHCTISDSLQNSRLDGVT